MSLFVVLVLVLVAVATACGAASTSPDLASLGLLIEADIQTGTTFEVSVPIDADTTLSVGTAPSGVNAAISSGTDGSLLLTVAVESDAPRGIYSLGLIAIRDGEEYELAWPFNVVDPG